MAHGRIESRRDSFSGIDPGILFDSAFNMEVCQLYNFVTHYISLMIKTPPFGWLYLGYAHHLEVEIRVFFFQILKCKRLTAISCESLEDS